VPGGKIWDLYLGTNDFFDKDMKRVMVFPWPVARHMVVWSFIFKKRVLYQPVQFEDLRQKGILQKP